MQVKQLVKEKLRQHYEKKYFREEADKTVTYDSWIRDEESSPAEKIVKPGTSFSFRRIPYEVCGECLEELTKNKQEEIILFAASEGEVSELAQPLIDDFFSSHPATPMLYGDEDVMSPERIRYTPWLKPDWSPDTFSSGFYFGSLCAIRISALQALTEDERREVRKTAEEHGGYAGMYVLCDWIAKRAGAYEKRKITAESDEFPIGHIDKVLFHSYTNAEMEWNQKIVPARFGTYTDTEQYAADKKGLLSVIIPSKDNVSVLKRCIESLLNSSRIPVEILVIDNGSSQQNRKELEHDLMKTGAIYCYEEMPFNFSAMCNLGAAASHGDVLLFLNDDTLLPAVPQSIIGGEGFPDYIYRQARKPYAGAVGAKLLYPDSERIQHAGIVNLRLGPVHKLQFMEDAVCWNYGYNRGIHNVIAVTGACLAVEAKKFAEAGGFCEDLPVAFNDVDLCFTIFEKGYYNSVLQDYPLYHYESLSRGQDETKEKLNRLLHEKQKLYAGHRSLYARDPFYHKYFASDILSSAFELQASYSRVKGVCSVPEETELTGRKIREDGCVHISIEYAGTMTEWYTGEAGCGGSREEYYIQGYSFISGSDNSVYEKMLLFERGDHIFIADVENILRKDVEQNLPDQTNVALSGFAVRIKDSDIEAGEYRLGIVFRDRCTGYRLYEWTNRFLQVF